MGISRMTACQYWLSSQQVFTEMASRMRLTFPWYLHKLLTIESINLGSLFCFLCHRVKWETCMAQTGLCWDVQPVPQSGDRHSTTCWCHDSDFRRLCGRIWEGLSTSGAYKNTASLVRQWKMDKGGLCLASVHDASCVINNHFSSLTAMKQCLSCE